MVGHRQPADLRHLREKSRLGAPEEFINGSLVNLNILDLEAMLGCHTGVGTFVICYPRPTRPLVSDVLRFRNGKVC